MSWFTTSAARSTSCLLAPIWFFVAASWFTGMASFLRTSEKQSFEADPEFDPHIEKHLSEIWSRYYCQSISATKIRSLPCN